MGQREKLEKERLNLVNDKWDGAKIEEIKSAERKLTGEKDRMGFHTGWCGKEDCVHHMCSECDDCFRWGKYERKG